ncbi:TPA: hypothetical protein P9G65_005533 [Pseudomonas aeruginosa]|nr:hypothetical protein [Pseudomonas aeruginosa]HDQ4723245.1 hypothetical protein [Pseudomonas aeruginosa]
MLIHICPRLMMPVGFELPCALIDVRVQEFGLHLIGDREVVARQPYANKRYYVACRKTGRKAINGLLIEVPGHVPLFTVVTRWSIAAEVVLRHRVNYVVLDDQFEAVTDEPMLWGMAGRVPDFLMRETGAKATSQGLAFPTAEFDFETNIAAMARLHGLQIETSERFLLPTLRARYLRPGATQVNERLPTAEMAFRVRAEEVNYG